MEIRRTLPKSSCGLPHDLRVPASQDINANSLTELCLSIAALMPGQYDAITDIINDYKRVFEPVAGAQEHQTCSCGVAGYGLQGIADNVDKFHSVISFGVELFSSESIKPSTIRILRVARLPNSGSWVTMIRVKPF